MFFIRVGALQHGRFVGSFGFSVKRLRGVLPEFFHCGQKVVANLHHRGANPIGDVLSRLSDEKLRLEPGVGLSAFGSCLGDINDGLSFLPGLAENLLGIELGSD